MDSNSSWARKAGVTQGKLVLIGVLAIVLMGVLYWQFAPSGAEAPSATASDVPRRKPADRDRARQPNEETPMVASPSTNPANRESARPVSSNWKPPKVSLVVQYDPFALPASFPQPLTNSAEQLAQMSLQDGQSLEARREELEKELQDIRAQLEALRHQGVHVIIQRKNEYIAMIGDRTIHVGDEINGFKVIGIDSDGVQIAHELNQ